MKSAYRPPRPDRRDDDAPLQRQIDVLRRQVHDLQEDGGNPDAKLLRRRFEFMEGRLAELERMSVALLDIATIQIEWLAGHLITRHVVGSDLIDRMPDTILARKAHRRLQDYRAKHKNPEAPSVPSAPSVQK